MHGHTIAFAPRPSDREPDDLGPSVTAKSLVKRAATVLVVWTSFDGRVAARNTTFEDAAEHSVHGSSRHHILFYLSLSLSLSLCYEGDIINSPT
uniref:Uncharacterized protein n=1 Tax=Noccaea caerulescens TaxID=107243 RepID=A0A1J3DH13_NOCCA